jgi:sodium transport system ATP-binding protein
MIETNQLTKIFEDKKRGPIRAVDQVSFRCEAGRIFGLLGANGAGKTTTLRMLATILKPTSGTATICGFDIAKESDKVRSTVGFLSTATALYDRLTAREMIEYFGKLNGMEGEVLKKRVDHLIERFGMGEFTERRCDKLSTGMKQKVSVARTIVHDPQVMIFDEPTAGLDVMTARTIIDFIRECRNQGKTVLFSTHVMREAERLCDTIAIIHGGVILGNGSLAQLRSQHGLDDLEDIFIKLVGGVS